MHRINNTCPHIIVPKSNDCQIKTRIFSNMQFLHQLELEKIFILLMNFAWIASYKIELDQKQ